VGILAKSASGVVVTLAAHSLIGRAQACFLRLDSRLASQEHARIQWEDGAWCLRDLGSRNGTRINGRDINPGQSVVLKSEDLIEFGSAGESWTLLDSSAPVAAGRELRSGQIIVARDGLLKFPGADPFPYVHQAGRHWILEQATEQRLVSDGEALGVGDQCWHLHLPLAVAATEAAEQPDLRLSTWQWHFFVSGDEEYVRLELTSAERKVDLGARAHTYLLLTLARLREGSDGWIYVDELCRMLTIEEQALNVHIFRARSELGRAGFEDAADVIERRRPTRQLRAGFDRFTVTAV
jgi:hypothetical protein